MLGVSSGIDSELVILLTLPELLWVQPSDFPLFGVDILLVVVVVISDVRFERSGVSVLIQKIHAEIVVLEGVLAMGGACRVDRDHSLPESMDHPFGLQLEPNNHRGLMLPALIKAVPKGTHPPDGIALNIGVDSGTVVYPSLPSWDHRLNLQFGEGLLGLLYLLEVGLVLLVVYVVGVFVSAEQVAPNRQDPQCLTKPHYYKLTQSNIFGNHKAGSDLLRILSLAASQILFQNLMIKTQIKFSSKIPPFSYFKNSSCRTENLKSPTVLGGSITYS